MGLNFTNPLNEYKYLDYKFMNIIGYLSFKELTSSFSIGEQMIFSGITLWLNDLQNFVI